MGPSSCLHPIANYFIDHILNSSTIKAPSTHSYMATLIRAREMSVQIDLSRIGADNMRRKSWQQTRVPPWIGDQQVRGGQHNGQSGGCGLLCVTKCVYLT
jgi:hypothetical protein